MGYQWSGWQKILLIIVPCFLMMTIFQTIGMIVWEAQFDAGAQSQTPLHALVLSFFNGLGVVFTFWLFMRYVDKQPFVELGFYLKGWLKALVVGFLCGFIIITLGLIVLLLLDEIRFSGVSFQLDSLVLMFLGAVMVAFIEELMFRGYLLRNLMDSFRFARTLGPYLALFVSAAIFAVVHAFNDNASVFSIMSILLAGIMLGLSYIYTQSLWFPIGLHLGWNFFQSLFGFNVSGNNEYSLFEIEILTPSLWNGGAFGFEGSMLAVLIQLVLIACMWQYYVRGNRTPKG